MQNIEFYKLSGSGNDFIIIDNRDKVVDENNLNNFIVNVCRRKMSVGADGFILIEKSETVDFKWRFFNSDGNEAEMCGNGARCAARFAYVNKIAQNAMSFETKAGIISAQVTNKKVKITMPNPKNLEIDSAVELQDKTILIDSVNTGVPHSVITMNDVKNVDVVKLGSKIRFHKKFAPAGTNVNFMSRLKNNSIEIRTYERGVEDETLACGTGAVACAIVSARKYNVKSPMRVVTRSGSYLDVYYKEKQGGFCDIYLEGNARIIYKGELWKEAWEK